MINLNTYQSNVLTNKSEFNWLKSPVPERDFIWLGQTYTGGTISEYEIFSKVENSFNNVRLRCNELLEFGLMGYEKYYYFTTFDGQFHIDKDIIDFLYIFKDKNGNEKIYNLSGQPVKYNNIITFKDVESHFSMASSPELKGNIYQYNFGYKINVMIDNKIFWFKVICCIPTAEKNTINIQKYFSLRLVCDNDLEGNLVIMKNGQYYAYVEAPLEKNTAGEFHWEVS